MEFTISGKIEESEIDSALMRLRLDAQEALKSFPGSWQFQLHRDGDKVKLSFVCIIRSPQGWHYAEKPHIVIDREYPIRVGKATGVKEALEGIYQGARITLRQMIHEALHAVPDSEIAQQWRDTIYERLPLKSSWPKD